MVPGSETYSGALEKSTERENVFWEKMELGLQEFGVYTGELTGVEFLLVHMVRCWKTTAPSCCSCQALSSSGIQKIMPGSTTPSSPSCLLYKHIISLINFTFIISLIRGRGRQSYQTKLPNKATKQSYQTKLPNKATKQSYQTKLPNQPTKPTNQTNQPTKPTKPTKPTNQPTSQPANQPTSQPANQPTSQPANQPTSQPTSQPTNQPTNQPASQPTSQPTNQPTNQPSKKTKNQSTNVRQLLWMPVLWKNKSLSTWKSTMFHQRRKMEKQHPDAGGF